jgi:hypothetical protein
MSEDVTRIQMEHQFAVDEVLTKVEILRRESQHLHQYNPIEHVSSRVNSPRSILDIAGVRITCSFIADTYRVLANLASQSDVRLITVKDYIAEPKPNGYKSLYAINEIPVFLSTGSVPIIVEVQIRTIAMDQPGAQDPLRVPRRGPRAPRGESCGGRGHCRAAGPPHGGPPPRGPRRSARPTGPIHHHRRSRRSDPAATMGKLTR